MDNGFIRPFLPTWSFEPDTSIERTRLWATFEYHTQVWWQNATWQTIKTMFSGLFSCCANIPDGLAHGAYTWLRVRIIYVQMSGVVADFVVGRLSSHRLFCCWALGGTPNAGALRVRSQLIKCPLGESAGLGPRLIRRFIDSRAAFAFGSQIPVSGPPSPIPMYP